MKFHEALKIANDKGVGCMLENDTFSIIVASDYKVYTSIKSAAKLFDLVNSSGWEEVK
jgi:hypothetical protein